RKKGKPVNKRPTTTSTSSFSASASKVVEIAVRLQRTLLSQPLMMLSCIEA
ncbi:unnamed protein product, partial [Arabidopsis halleri]